MNVHERPAKFQSLYMIDVSAGEQLYDIPPITVPLAEIVTNCGWSLCTPEKLIERVKLVGSVPAHWKLLLMSAVPRQVLLQLTAT